MGEAAAAGAEDPVLRSEQGGELILRGSGGIAVATDRMHAELERCAVLGEAATSVLERLRVARLACGPGAWLAPADAADSLLRRSRELAAGLADAVALAARGYVDAEHVLEAAGRMLAGRIAGQVGLAARLGGGGSALALIANPFLLGAAVGWLVADALDPESASPLDWLVQNPAVITDPTFARLIELIATSSDDFVLSLLGLPPGATLLLGEDALGLTGVAIGARLVVGAAGAVGIARETPVAITRETVRPGEEGAPTGSADRLSRVPDGGPQLRIERYDAPGQASRWVVYVGPTYDFALTGDQPWDMTSNLHAVAGGSPASLRAVELALADAGIVAGQEVQFVGFSQGGIIAARAAASGEWNAVGLETFGSPVGTIDLPDSVTGLVVRHTDDFVPSAGGPDAGGGGVLRVERRAFLPGADLPAMPAPAHQRSSYLATAAVIDAAESESVVGQRDRLTAFAADYLAAGGSMTVYEYSAVRTG